MIERIIETCGRNRGLVLVVTAAIVALGIWSANRITVDAVPDLSDTQVVVVTELPGQSPQIIEDQVTNPIARNMLGVPKARDVRGFSMYGVSFVYVIFQDGTDLYWARDRVLEKISALTDQLPSGANAQIGPDATGVGWIFQYVLLSGKYSPAYPNGFWYDPKNEEWYTDPADAANPDRLERIRAFTGSDIPDTCPVSGEQLIDADIDLAELRSLQDWFLRYELNTVSGVSEIASIGGFVKQYQIKVDPLALYAHQLTLDDVAQAVRSSNRDSAGRSLELSESEYMIRGIGYLGSLTSEELENVPNDGVSRQRARTKAVQDDLALIPLKVNSAGQPILLRDVARIQVGPDIRQGIATWNDKGDVAGAIVVMRQGENAKKTIESVRNRLQELERSLPPGVQVAVGYDRSDLIDRSVQTLYTTLIKEMLAVTLVMMIFLLHARSTFVAALVLPCAVLMSLTVMHFVGINANIMSLGGIAIAIGVMVDCSIVMVDHAHRRLTQANPDESRETIVLQAAREVGPTLFFSLLIITISFLPILLLGEQSGRLFKPLAYTKTFSMAAASLLAITLIPAMMLLFLRNDVLPAQWGALRKVLVVALVALLPAIALSTVSLGAWDSYRWYLVFGWVLLMVLLLAPQKIRADQDNPLTRLLEYCYRPCLIVAIRYRHGLLLGAVGLIFFTAWYPLRDLGTEFMPPLEEGDILYMPTTVEPGLSITKARELLQQTDRIIYQFPEVKSVMGKIGRAESATDPAPLNMIESTIVLHRDAKKWRHMPRERFFTHWPKWARWLPAKIFSESRPITMDELIYGFELPDGTPIPGLDSAVQLPGLANAWTMPIRARIDMLSTGIRTPVGIKVMGSDLQILNDLAQQIENLLKTDESTGPYTASGYAEQTLGGKYVEILPDRQALARHGISIDVLNATIATAIGGAMVTETVEGQERYPVQIRYPSELRDNLPLLREVLVDNPNGSPIPLGELATVRLNEGPSMIKSENARLTSWVYVEIRDKDVGGYVRSAQELVESQIDLPPGYSIVWSGQFEYIENARQQFAIAIPLTLMAIAVLLYAATRSWLRVLLIFSTLSFSVVGAIWFVWLLDYNLSVAVLVGIIALLGLDAETSLIMLLYLDQSYEDRKKADQLKSRHDLWMAVYEGAVQRIRPKTMTVVTTFFGLLPLLLATGAGADTMKRLAAPMVGGLATSFLLELLIYPALYYMARKRQNRF